MKSPDDSARSVNFLKTLDVRRVLRCDKWTNQGWGGGGGYTQRDTKALKQSHAEIQ